MKFRFLALVVLFASLLFSCKSGSVNLFKAASPHEIYQRKLISAGLDKTAIGTAWINAADISMQRAPTIVIPYKETGYFSSEKANAAAYKFKAVQGEKISISLTDKTPDGAIIYMDVWRLTPDGNFKLLASADTLENDIKLDIDEGSEYLVRLQPELLKSSGYTLKITSGPSLGFPTKTGINNIGSFWGDGRDRNNRKHEGVDIFGTFRSPVVATNDGTVTRVNENNLGGKVVWFRPKGKDYTLYYAHLDQQIVTEGQEVLAGDILGLMGNTGNARTTPPHLHFGIYTSNGAINPLPFINPVIQTPQEISAPVFNLNKTLRTAVRAKVLFTLQKNSNNTSELPAGTIVIVNSATGTLYKVTFPDGNTGFIKSTELTGVSKAIQKIRITNLNDTLYDNPDSLAAIKQNLKPGKYVSLLGNFGNYQLISDEDLQIGWIKK